MKQLLTVLSVFTVMLLFTSCATIYPNQKLLIGKWKTIDVQKYDIPGSKVTAGKQTQGKTAGTDVNLTANATPGADSLNMSHTELSKAEQQLTRLIFAEKRSTLTVNPDKTAIKEYPGKTIHGKWKMKSNNRLWVVSKETDKKLFIDIQSINDSLAIVKQTLPVGGLKITYRKVK